MFRNVVTAGFDIKTSKSSCRCGNYESLDADESEISIHGRFWEVPISDYLGGQFSFACAGERESREQRSQVDRATGVNGVFTGLYDGDEGSEASQFVLDNLMEAFMTNVRKLHGDISEQVLERAVADTEFAFISQVHDRCVQEPLLARVGSCCLIVVIWEGVLYVANVGDSKAVLGYYNPADKLRLRQLTTYHTAENEKIRSELKVKHPESDIVVCGKDGNWLIKGAVKVSRFIGHLYLKYPNHQVIRYREHLNLQKIFFRPVLRSDAETFSLQVKEDHSFLILATRGLWDQLSTHEAVKIVHDGKRKGSAKRLIAETLRKASAKKRITNEAIMADLQGANRQSTVSEITAIIIFLQNGPNNAPQESFVAFENHKRHSQFGLCVRMEKGSTSQEASPSEGTSQEAPPSEGTPQEAPPSEDTSQEEFPTGCTYQ